MSLTVALQMDPLAPIDIEGDSSFALGLEAQKRGYKLMHYGPWDLSYQNGEITAWMADIELRREKGNHFSQGARVKRPITDVDVVLMRQDPPFDMQYISATHLLEQVHPKPFVCNHPVSVRNAPEKLLVTQFADLMPPTLITHSMADMKAFRAEYKDIIVKPLFGNGGAGVFHLKPDDENLSALVENHIAVSREPLMVQAYLPEIRQGDKRVIIVDGEPIGAINRIPAEGEARANMHVGGRADPVGLTDRDREVCERLKPLLGEQDLIFVGIDMIGDWLTEINVTSPTGLQELQRFSGVDGAALIWDAIEKRV